MTDTLRLSAFALPPTFPPESVPDACTCFVRECVPGLTKRQLLARRGINKVSAISYHKH